MTYSLIGDGSTSWAGMTADEIGNIAGAAGSIFLLPIGSIEQHGNHLPVATDTILVEAIAQLGADHVSDEIPILTGPPFWAGFSPHHLPFGGTLSLEFSTMREAIEDVVDSALSNGFDVVLLLNGHGGNKALIGAVTSTIGTEHPDTEVLGLTYFDLAGSFIDELRDSDTGGMAHGGEFETSLMLHLRPDLVREESMDAQNLDEPYEHGDDDLLASGPLSVYRGFDEYSQSGAVGNPSTASAEKGKRIYEHIGEELEDLILKIHENNR